MLATIEALTFISRQKDAAAGELHLRQARRSHDVRRTPSAKGSTPAAIQLSRQSRLSILRTSIIFSIIMLACANAAAAQRIPIEDRISEFVAQAYFKAGYPSEIDPAHIYTYIVDYWGKGILPRSRVLAEKRAIYRRWPIRKFELFRGTLRVSQMPKNPEFYLIEFRYLFDVSGPKGYRSGEALARLIVIEGGRYGFLVYAEDGKVGERF
jgi:hypothetical protein